MESGRVVDLNAGAGTFEGALTAPFKGVASGGVTLARGLNLGMSLIPAAIDEAYGTHTRDWWFENMMLERTARRVAPNPREVGMAGQLLHSLFDIGSQALAGGPELVLIGKTVGKSIEGVEEGLDVPTAGAKGLIEGGSAAAGVALPIAMKPLVGSRIPGLVQQIGYGVATNVPMGVASRALTHKVLEDAGYREMAEQYKALDEGGLLTDFVLGAAFGTLGHALQAKGGRAPHIEPADVDAALTKGNAYHLEVDTAPGLAKNAETRDAHVDAVLKATEDLIAGRQVDVAHDLRAADFQPYPDVDRVRGELAGEIGAVMAPIRKALTQEEAARTSPDYVESRRQLAEIDEHLGRLDQQLRAADEAGKPEEVARLRTEVETMRADRERLDQQAHANLQALVARENPDALGGKQEPLGRAAEPKTEHVHQALQDEGVDITDENVAKVKRIALARSIDAKAVDALPERMADGEYMAKIGEIINAKQGAEAADKGGAKPRGERAGPAADQARAAEGEQGGEARRGGGEAKPSGESTRHIDDAEVRAAEVIAEQYPGMFVTLDDGTTVSAHEAIQMANEAIAKAQVESRGFEAAVLCALRVGE